MIKYEKAFRANKYTRKNTSHKRRLLINIPIDDDLNQLIGQMSNLMDILDLDD